MQFGESSCDFRVGLPRSLGDVAVTHAIQNLGTKFPKLKLHAFVQWSGVLLERLADRKLDAAVVHLPKSSVPPSAFVAEHIGTNRVAVVAAKSARFSQPATLKELSTNL
jgi:DNA-binding transcriptional LysR family regulator